jgi:hypothetical protein
MPSVTPWDSAGVCPGPKAPVGKQGNWQPGTGQGLLRDPRLQRPIEVAIAKGWKPGDTEKTS